MKKRLLAILVTGVLVLSSSFCSLAKSVSEPLSDLEPFTLNDITSENVEWWLTGTTNGDFGNLQILDSTDNRYVDIDIAKIKSPLGQEYLLYVTNFYDNDPMHKIKLVLLLIGVTIK